MAHQSKVIRIGNRYIAYGINNQRLPNDYPTQSAATAASILAQEEWYKSKQEAPCQPAP